MFEALCSPFCQRLTLALLHFCWQGCGIALGIWGVLTLARFRTAEARYAASVAALVLMGLCPVITLLILQASEKPWQASPTRDSVPTAEVARLPGRAIGSSRGIDNAPTPQPISAVTDQAYPAVAITATWQQVWDRSACTLWACQPGFLLAWQVGVIVLAVRLLLGHLETIQLRRDRQRIPAVLARRAKVIGQRLGISTGGQVFGSRRVDEAIALGFVKPIVLIPLAWLSELPPTVLEAVIAHELAHLRRCDRWVNLAQRMLEILLFFHPAVWWLSNRIRLEREMCCDELAVTVTGRRVSYAHALEQIGRRCVTGEPSLATAFAGNRRMNLLSRVQNILAIPREPEAGRCWPAGLAVVLLALLAVCFSNGLIQPRFASADDRGAVEEPAPRRSPETDPAGRRSPEGQKSARRSVEAGRRLSPEAARGPRRFAEAEAGSRRSPEADSGPRRSVEAETGPRPSPEARLGNRRSVEAETGRRLSPEAARGPRRSAEAETGSRRSPEADSGPRRSVEAATGPRPSPEARLGSRRSAESETGRRLSPEAASGPRRPAEAEAASRRSPEADSGPRRSVEAATGPRPSPEARLGSRRSAESETGRRLSPEAASGPRRPAEAEAASRQVPERQFDRDRREPAVEARRAENAQDHSLNGFEPQTRREAALLQIIQQLQGEVNELRRQMDQNRPEEGERSTLGEEQAAPPRRQRTRQVRIFKAYDRDGKQAIGLESGDMTLTADEIIFRDWSGNTEVEAGRSTHSRRGRGDRRSETAGGDTSPKRFGPRDEESSSRIGLRDGERPSSHSTRDGTTPAKVGPRDDSNSDRAREWRDRD